MNHEYIKDLICANRHGLLIKLIKENKYKWSTNDYNQLLDSCLTNHHVSIYMLNEIIETLDETECETITDVVCNFGGIKIIKYLLSDSIYQKNPKFRSYVQKYMTNDIEIYDYSDYYPEDCSYSKKYVTCDNHAEWIKYITSNTISIKFSYMFQWNNRMSFSCKYGTLRSTKYLLSDELTSIYNINKINIITEACGNKKTNIIKYLLSSKVTYKYSKMIISCDSLISAIENKNKNMIKYIMSSKIRKKYPIIYKQLRTIAKYAQYYRCAG